MIKINIQEIYKEINTLQYSLLPNENKANELRKLDYLNSDRKIN